MKWLLFFVIFRIGADGDMESKYTMTGTKVFLSKVACDKEGNALTTPDGFKMISVCIPESTFKEKAK